jgi:hypothetical protein
MPPSDFEFPAPVMPPAVSTNFTWEPNATNASAPPVVEATVPAVEATVPAVEATVPDVAE